jgi:periplasmic divalent cation tolerance protein
MSRFVYVTTANVDEAQRIGRELIEAHLAACVNILPGMTSMYRWDNRVQENQEVVLIAKTTALLVPALTERIKALHSYACPCVVSLAIEGGNPDFITWIESETRL